LEDHRLVPCGNGIAQILPFQYQIQQLFGSAVMSPRPDPFVGYQHYNNQFDNQEPSVCGGKSMEQDLKGVAHDEQEYNKSSHSSTPHDGPPFNRTC
jgi:hypothetical protein